MSSSVPSSVKVKKSKQHYFSVEEQAKEILYRIPKRVTEVRLYVFGSTSAVCPSCSMGLNREYMRFCDYCGQKLSWKCFGQAKITKIPLRNPPKD